MRNPQLEVGRDNLAWWNRAENRRHGFHSIHRLNRRGLGLRSGHVLPLRDRHHPAIAERSDVARLTALPSFSAMVVAQGRDVLFEAHASDCGPDTLHSMQSITKTHLNLVFGRLMAAGRVDPGQMVETWIPEIGSGYRGVTLQQVLDMNVPLAFDEDYAAPWDPPPGPGERRGYGQEEVAMGWRLPPPGREEFGVREFALTLEKDMDDAPGDRARYASPNTDLAGWVAERASGSNLFELISATIEGAGLEGVFFVSLDCTFVPVLSGGGAMTARDMARYGLLFARKGTGVMGESVGDAGFIEATRTRKVASFEGSWPGLSYSNHMFTDGTWIGHGGYAGQFLMIRPDKEAAAAWFSVVDSVYGDAEDHSAHVIAMLSDVLENL